ncbi:MAG: zinc ribbon domain-containing protein [Ruminococcaceae bacterium]|nr:zinc ribbon domain-containing protein [Oscillospiraceae bacterium]
MKVCMNCHLTYDDGAQVCAQCGNPLTYVVPQQTDPADHTADFDTADISENKVFAMLPYLMGWIGIVIALLAGSKSAYAAFHVRQALKIQICNALLGMIAAILAITIIAPIAAAVCICILGIVNIICFFQVCAGKAKEPAIIRNLGFLK